MKSKRRTPSFQGLLPASARASAAARAASPKTNTKVEKTLRRELWSRGLRYRLHSSSLPGRPDIVFSKARVVIFCDGDFWHGRDLEQRIAKLSRGHNAPYWVAKIKHNVERDARQAKLLSDAGWLVLRFWESDIARNLTQIVKDISDALRHRQTCKM